MATLGVKGLTATPALRTFEETQSGPKSDASF